MLQHDEEHLENSWNGDMLVEYRSDLIYLNLVSLQDALIELLWFYRVNYEAMNRIYIKLVGSGQASSSELEDYRHVIRGQSAEHRKAYNKCVDQLNRVQARVAAYQSDKSASRVNSHTLDHDHRVVAAISRESSKMSIMQMRSGHGWSPLHFSATYGMVNLCMHVLSSVSPIEKYVLLQDDAGLTPLHISVARGHVEVAQLLLSAIDKPSMLIPGDLLHIALRHEDDAMVKLLVSRSVGLKHKSSSGESCLYIAAQLGRTDYLHLLLPNLGPDFIDTAESACQWTPLFIGCVEGHISTVKLLLEAGADSTRLDYLGWTAQENAAFRGHLPVAEVFSTINATLNLSCSLPRNGPQRKKASSFEVNPGLGNVILNLGGLQEGKLSKSSTLDLPGTLGHGLVLSISTSESSTSIERMVPLLDDPVDDTLVFAVKHPSEATIIFKVRKGDAERDDRDALIGIGVAFLYAQKTCLGARHGTLLREQSVPILCKDTLRLLGTVTFSFLIVEPYYQLECPSPSMKCLGDPGSVQLVGHRGACFPYTGISHMLNLLKGLVRILGSVSSSLEKTLLRYKYTHSE